MVPEDMPETADESQAEEQLIRRAADRVDAISGNIGRRRKSTDRMSPDELRARVLELETESAAKDEQYAALECRFKKIETFLYDRITGLERDVLWWPKYKACHTEVRQGRKQSLVVILGDIDNFKRINDTYGHTPVGDNVIRIASHVWRELTKKFTHENENQPIGAICRYGGEEFIACLFDLTDPVAIAEEVRELMEQMEFDEFDERVTMSFGVSVMVTGERIGPTMLIRQADSALYVSKHSGRNRVTRWASGMKLMKNKKKSVTIS